jgi:integrase
MISVGSFGYWFLTGCRRAEIGGLRWSEIHDDAIHLPPERTKNGRAHVVALTDMAREIIDSIPRRVDRDFLFGAWSTDGFDTWQAKATFQDGISKAWTLHDLRRSVATGLANLGIQPHIIECVLNHTAHRAGVSGVYNLSSYTREVKTALAMWADHVASITSGTERKVVPLRVS